MDVILPQPGPEELIEVAAKGDKYPVLYLLHGMSDDHTIWQRRTSIERYVDPLKLVVVMPIVHRGFYVVMAHGPRYGTFVAEELPVICQSLFPISSAREDNFVAGLSMGGYGAFRLGLAYPEQFSAAARLSGAVDIATFTGHRDKKIDLGLDLTYEEGPGAHEWSYWDTQIQHVLAWLPLIKTRMVVDG